MTKKLMILLSLIFVFQITNVFADKTNAKKDDWVVKEKKVSETGQFTLMGNGKIIKTIRDSKTNYSQNATLGQLQAKLAKEKIIDLVNTNGSGWGYNSGQESFIPNDMQSNQPASNDPKGVIKAYSIGSIYWNDGVYLKDGNNYEPSQKVGGFALDRGCMLLTT